MIHVLTWNAKHPRQVREKGLSKLIAERAIRCGVMQKTSLLEGQKVGKGKNRNKVFRTHGFRKTVTYKMKDSGISELDIDKLLGHKSKGRVTGAHYYRPDEDYLLGEYLKAVDALTINEENRLKRQVEQLTIRTDKLDRLAAQVSRLSKRMGLVEEDKENNVHKSGLDHITQELSDNLEFIDYYNSDVDT